MPRGYDPYNDPYSDQIGELIRARGDIAARSALESGDIWGRGIQNIAGQLAGGVQQYAQEREKQELEKKEKERLTVQAAAVNRAIETNDVKALFRILPPDKAAIIAKGLETHQPDAIKKYGDVMTILKAGARANKALPEGSRPTGWVAQIDDYVQNGVLTPEQGQKYRTYDPDVETRIANWGEEQAKAPELEKIEIRNADGSITTQFVPKVAGPGYTSAAPPKEQKTPWSDPFTGPDGVSYQRNTATGEIRPTPGVGAKPPEAPKPITPQQQQVAGFYKRAVAAEEILKDLEGAGKGKPGGLEFVTAERMLPEDRKKYLQAQRDWIAAFLRRESQAQIGKEETRSNEIAYFPQPGDTDAVILQKAASRKLIEDNLAAEAGGAGGAGGAGASPLTVTAPNGKVYTFPTQEAANAFKKSAGL